MRVSSFNIYFFGDRGSVSPQPKVIRDEGDLQMLAEVVAGLDADLIAFEEIHDRDLLQHMLDLASARRPGRSWQVVAASAEKVRQPFQVVVAADRSRVTVRNVSTPITAVRGGRRPVVVDAEVDGMSVQILAVHMVSGLLDEPHDGPVATRRATECERLRSWMASNPTMRRIVLGDFNALPEHPSLAPLCTIGELRWLTHEWPQGARRWTTFVDAAFFNPCAIDHVLALGFDGGRLEVACFDLREDLHRDGLTWRAWLSAGGRLERISDHRPVVAELSLAAAGGGRTVTAGAAPLALSELVLTFAKEILGPAIAAVSGRDGRMTRAEVGHIATRLEGNLRLAAQPIEALFARTGFASSSTARVLKESTAWVEERARACLGPDGTLDVQGLPSTLKTWAAIVAPPPIGAWADLGILSDLDDTIIPAGGGGALPLSAQV